MSFFPLSCLITSFISFIFGIFVFLNKKNRLNFLWFLTSISISIWSLGFFGVVYFTGYNWVWFSQYLLDIGGILIPISFFNFIIKFLKLKNGYKKIAIFSWLIAVFLIVLNFTTLFKKGMVPYENFNYWINPGPFYFLFPLIFVFFSLYAFILLLKKFRESDDKIFRAQIKYIIIAHIIGFGGGVTNFFPQLFKVYPFGNYLVVLYVFFISYSILKYHLFNIKILATELFTFAISVALIVRTLLAENLYDLIINGVIAILVSVFGVLLIRSVLKEVKQREQLEKMAGDIKKAYEVEKKAHEELQRLDDAKTQFTMATQHHLRTPLTSMRGYIDLIMSGTYGKIPAKLKEPLLKFEISTKRLIKIVNEFLDISQFQLGKQVVSLKPGVKIAPILQEIIEELKFEIEAKSLYMHLEKPKEAFEVKADEEKLKLALFNLLDNAVKYTQKGGVTVDVKDGEKVKIVIKDTGIGIAKEELSNIFGRTFERGKEAKRIFTTGRGIGLYITNEIVKAHNGRVWAESEGLGRGSAFFVELPVG